MPSLDWLEPRSFTWTPEQVAWLTDSDNMLKWGTQSLMQRVVDFENKFD